jgi:predicted CXXCH cytochrome family protein
MTRNVWSFLVAATLPCAAIASGVVGSKHDLSSLSGNTTKATTDTETCKFCHSPHHLPSNRLLFNKTRSVASYTWGGSATATTAGGTILPTSLVGHRSALCMGCHDGTVAVGAVFNAGNGSAGVIAVSGNTASGGFLNAGPGLLTRTIVAGTQNPDGTAAGGSADINGNHPFGIPYAGSTYFGVSSTEPADGSPGDYWPVASGATAPSAEYIATGAAAISLVPGTGGAGLGVECGTCHDVHNLKDNNKLTIIKNDQSALCRSCHVR